MSRNRAPQVTDVYVLKRPWVDRFLVRPRRRRVGKQYVEADG